MKIYIPRFIALAAIIEWVVIAGNMAHAQTAAPLLMGSVDQSEFPQVTAQPVDQAVLIGSNAVLSVQAVNADNYQWLRNNVLLEGQTNSSLVIEQVGIGDAGSYSCDVSQAGGEAVPTRAASLNVVVTSAGAVAASVPGGRTIYVYGLPKVGGGTQGNCPGPYAGYVSYTRTISQGWGWAPSTNATIFTAADGGGRTDTTVVFLGKYGDNDCDQTIATIPAPPFSPKYRFAIYFPNDVPTTNYPIILTGFNP
jgi:hypothetical protein